jgi:hypothetical protein
VKSVHLFLKTKHPPICLTFTLGGLKATYKAFAQLLKDQRISVASIA